MARERVLTIQRTIYMTPEMWGYLAQLAKKRGRDCNENVLIREAVRNLIDSQADVLSSRRHFQKSFQERIDQLEEQLLKHQARDIQTILFYLHLLVQLVAFSLAHIMSAVTRKEISAQQLIQRALIEARREETLLAVQVERVREMSVPDKPA
ncbi:MAG: hypothetical protein ACYDBJ_07170 [Aggregatilineales bacterium]